MVFLREEITSQVLGRKANVLPVFSVTYLFDLHVIPRTCKNQGGRQIFAWNTIPV